MDIVYRQVYRHEANSSAKGLKQRIRATIIAVRLADEAAWLEQHRIESSLYDIMERGIR